LTNEKKSPAHITEEEKQAKVHICRFSFKVFLPFRQPHRYAKELKCEVYYCKRLGKASKMHSKGAKIKKANQI